MLYCLVRSFDVFRVILFCFVISLLSLRFTAFFPDVHINNKTFVDGGFLANNPVELGIVEAYRIWPKRFVVDLPTRESTHQLYPRTIAFPQHLTPTSLTRSPARVFAADRRHCSFRS